MEALQAAVGQSLERHDVITRRMAEEVRATFAPHPLHGEVPLGLHWGLAPPIAPSDRLQADGHPTGDGLLPAMPGLRRMWAGGELEILGALAIGDAVIRRSTLQSVTRREGRSGALLFAALGHEYLVGGATVIRERHDIVYRQPAASPAAPPPAAPPPAAPAEPDRADLSWTVETSPTLLFRYSALTFNGHRIHYDLPYAVEQEGYAGLVVHGPLQATVLLNLAAAVLGRAPQRFTYRALSPLICGAPFVARAGRTGGTLSLATTSAGVPAMVAEAR